MHAPAYLHLSRHRVFYLRWPLPKALHPQGRPSTVKVSLGTCDKRQALHLARSLGYSAERLIAKGTATGMTFEDIRAAIKEHFRAMLERRKAGIAAEGRLDAEAVRLHSSLETAQDALKRDTPLSLTTTSFWAASSASMVFPSRKVPRLATATKFAMQYALKYADYLRR